MKNGTILITHAKAYPYNVKYFLDGKRIPAERGKRLESDILIRPGMTSETKKAIRVHFLIAIKTPQEKVSELLKNSRFGYIEISNGTFLESDLISACIDFLNCIGSEEGERIRKVYKIPRKAIGNYRHKFWHDEFGDQKSMGDPDIEYAIQALENAIDLLCPEGYRFGSHEGDGSCFGIWPCGNDEYFS